MNMNKLVFVRSNSTVFSNSTTFCHASFLSSAINLVWN